MYSWLKMPPSKNKLNVLKILKKVKAGTVRMWVAGKTVIPLIIHTSHSPSERFRDAS